MFSLSQVIEFHMQYYFRTRNIRQDYTFLGNLPDKWWKNVLRACESIELPICIIKRDGEQYRLFLSGMYTKRNDTFKRRIRNTFVIETEQPHEASSIKDIVLEWLCTFTQYVEKMYDPTLSKQKRKLRQHSMHELDYLSKIDSIFTEEWVDTNFQSTQEELLLKFEEIFPVGISNDAILSSHLDLEIKSGLEAFFEGNRQYFIFSSTGIYLDKLNPKDFYLYYWKRIGDSRKFIAQQTESTVCHEHSMVNIPEEKSKKKVLRTVSMIVLVLIVICFWF